MKKVVTVLLTVTMMVSLLTGCKSSDTETSSLGTAEETAAETAPEEATQAPADDSIIIGMCNANLAEPWNVQMDADVARAAANYPNVTVEFKDAAGDSLTQRSQVEEFINEKVDALIISPVESTPMTEIVTDAYESGIPVFLVGRLIDSNLYTQYIGTDDFSLGYAAGQWVIDNFGGTAPNVVELDGLMTSSCGYDRHIGFMKAIEGSDVNVIYTSDCKWLEDMGRSEMESVLSVHDDIDVVFGGNDPTAHGAYLAAEAADRAGNIAFFGIDGLAAEGQAYVRDGVFAMTICDATGGDIAVDQAMKYLKGEVVDKVILKDAIIYEKDTLQTGGTVVSIPEDVDRTGQQTPMIDKEGNTQE